MNLKRRTYAKATRQAALKALDMLALALVNERHQWTPQERRAYERAVKVLV